MASIRLGRPASISTSIHSRMRVGLSSYPSQQSRSKQATSWGGLASSSNQLASLMPPERIV